MTSGDIPQEVYVWQRVWTDEVVSAVEKYSPEFNKSIFLAAEISYRGDSDTWTCQAFQDPIEYAQQDPTNYGLAFRIQTNAAQSKWSNNSLTKVDEFIQLHIGNVSTIQIDYDCPSKKLADYIKLMAHLRKKFPNKKLEITCLPDWLNKSTFSELIGKTDRYIMQVHGVSGHGKGQALCDTIHTQKVAHQCAQLGHPFLIALPTYRHAISYSQNGTIQSVASEGNFHSSNYEIVSANAPQISSLIKLWQQQRPELMQGVIWYRLPVITDKMNWTSDTFQKTRNGESIDPADLDFKVSLNTNGSYQLSLTNNSSQHLDWPKTLDLTWSGFCIAHHLSSHFSIEQCERSQGATLKWNHNTPYPISPEETINLGSFRFTKPNVTIKSNITQL